MSYGIKRYNQNSALQMTSRQIEVMAFGQTILLLKNVKNQKERIHALTMNQKLWSSILLETSIEDNGISDILRKDLLNLAIWSTRYSIRAMLHDIPLKPLIEINQDILDGLKPNTNHQNMPIEYGEFKLSDA
ncbi:flagellar biosynthesis regulator FlaF [Acetobacter sp.]|jgi:flagellar protein FlaF|uniref:flagellar biosynthesis regulator FlaF n=1 Tax=Acetobacter sp. TaxID=440 RepID=UPI0025B9C6D3|nr:flagellar biosynthesis regulator FlaF [Acetobacter sp.]MCH4090717.1 flagellar biosynthesis regulator FlaF [Acetobacter sp.]MCI1300160.1 flagellar biosynthesis regulator FlaF [Acetobacter sp.]MCI1316578.1 flagellar biosynthesis regulator FlaF [Acetobacter sp.]